METKRRAPKAGYDNSKKHEYRHSVWKHLSANSKDILKSNPNSKVLLMPSQEGFEIDVCLSYGIKPEQIIAIDENPALLAHAKWKHKIPKENRFGVKVSKIGEKIKNNGWCLAAANLDFCNNFSKELIDESKSFFKDTPLCDGFSFAVTLMKGRETKALLEMIMASDVLYDVENLRLQAWLQIINHGFKGLDTLFEGDYFDTSPMAYGIFKTLNSVPIVFTHDKSIALVDEVFNMSYSETNLKLPENEKRVRYYIEYLNKSAPCFPIEDDNKLKNRYNIPANIWESEVFFAGCSFNYNEKEYLINEFKMWFRGRLTKKRTANLFFEVDENYDLDTSYFFFGVPNGTEKGNSYDLESIMKVGERHLKNKTNMANDDIFESLMSAFGILK